MLVDKNPAHWKLLVFYYNRQEPRLFVAKRSGLGYTPNFARPAIWAITGLAFACLTVAAVVNNLPHGR